MPREEQQNGSRAHSYSHTTTSKAEESLQPTSVLPGESLEGSRVLGPFLWLQKISSRDQDYSVQPIPLIFGCSPKQKLPGRGWEGTAGCPCCQGSPDMTCLLGSSFLCHSWKFSQTRNVLQLKQASSSSPALLPHETGAAAQRRAGFCPPGDGTFRFQSPRIPFLQKDRELLAVPEEELGQAFLKDKLFQSNDLQKRLSTASREGRGIPGNEALSLISRGEKSQITSVLLHSRSKGREEQLCLSHFLREGTELPHAVFTATQILEGTPSFLIRRKGLLPSVLP